MKKFNVAVVGATGAVGRAMCDILIEREFPINNLYAIASNKSVGKTILCSKPKKSEQSYEITVQSLENFDFANADIALFSAGSKISEIYAIKAANSNCVVIDNTSAFRMDPKVPLVVAEINHNEIKATDKIIANPNCSVMGITLAISPIHKAATIKTINVCTYQSVSGAGYAAMEELKEQTKTLVSGEKYHPKMSKVFEKQIAFNLIPKIGNFTANGYTDEEIKIVREIKKILSDESLKIVPTVVRVPVFYGHSIAIHMETKKYISRTEVLENLRKAPGIVVFDEMSDGYYVPTPAENACGTDPVYVARVRESMEIENGISMWITFDNTRKGAALNAVQIAELIVQKL